jgi:enoyl-CoA hydratase
MPGESSFVSLSREGAVGVITLHREPFNSYDDRLLFELDSAWGRAAMDPGVRVVVLEADGKHFCAGAYLGNDRQERPTGSPRLTPWDQFDLVRNIPKPTIAAVQGGCVGGGQRMVFPCDLIFCSDDAFFVDPTAALGIGGIQSHLHTWFYGPRLAKEMIWSGNRLPAKRLYEMGSVNRLYPRQELRDAARSFAAEIAEVDPPVLRQAKRASNMTTDIMGMHYISSRMAELMDTDQPLTMRSAIHGSP